jgi:diadenosine tetraphosphate (Ap4A) HIT family hydrolase
MLMMVDPDVHFHVLPRYSGARDFAGTRFADDGWPGPPKLEPAVVLDDPLRDALRARLIEAWS